MQHQAWQPHQHARLPLGAASSLSALYREGSASPCRCGEAGAEVCPACCACAAFESAALLPLAACSRPCSRCNFSTSACFHLNCVSWDSSYRQAGRQAAAAGARSLLLTLAADQHRPAIGLQQPCCVCHPPACAPVRPRAHPPTHPPTHLTTCPPTHLLNQPGAAAAHVHAVWRVIHPLGWQLQLEGGQCCKGCGAACVKRRDFLPGLLPHLVVESGLRSVRRCRSTLHLGTGLAAAAPAAHLAVQIYAGNLAKPII